MRGRIAEIFESVQGEGLYLGEKQIFVRLFGCNLSCRFCDTKLDCFTEYDPRELEQEINLYRDKYHSVSFTGGEPLLQKDFLLEALKVTKRLGHTNYLETNGTLFSELEDVIDYVDIIAMDIKLPTSSGMGKLWGFHKKFLEAAANKETFIKAIICESTSEDDLADALKIINDAKSSAVLILQPNSQENQELLSLKLDKFKDLCRKEMVTACVIPQMHKRIGVK